MAYWKPSEVKNILVYRPHPTARVYKRLVRTGQGDLRELHVAGNKEELRELMKEKTFESAIVFRPENSIPFISKPFIKSLPDPRFVLYESTAPELAMLGEAITSRGVGDFTEEDLLPFVELSAELAGKERNEMELMRERGGSRDGKPKHVGKARKEKAEKPFHWTRELDADLVLALGTVVDDELRRENAAAEFQEKLGEIGNGVTIDDIIERHDLLLKRRENNSRRVSEHFRKTDRTFPPRILD